MQTRVFISYSSDDLDVATNICMDLEQHGKKCWMAPRDIPPGMEYGEEIIRGIESSDAFILVLSQASNASQHVLREVERGVNKKLPLFVIKIQDCTLSKSLEYFLLTNQWIDATQGINGKLDSLIESLNHIAVKEVIPENIADADQEKKIDEEKKSSKTGIIISLIGLVIIILLCVVILLIVKKPTLPESVSLASSMEQTVESVGQLPEWNEGDYVSFGRYYPEGYQEINNDGDIKWQIIDSNEEENTVTMISAQIIDIKPFDCAESGVYGKDHNSIAFYSDDAPTEITDEQLKECFGSNNWLTSDLRAWLNATGAVSYASGSQSDSATDEYGNGFENQLGFLSSFRNDEIAMLCDIKIDDGTSDRVTLLSTDEVTYYSQKDFFVLHPTVTKSAGESDATSWYNAFANSGCPDYLWVTRTPWDVNTCDIMVVDSSFAQELYVPYYSASSGFGIRPVIMIDVSNFDNVKIDGEGSNVLPYTVTFIESD